MTQDSLGQPSVVTAKAVTREFSPGVGVSDLTIEIKQGTILGLVGPSGSGKTTAVRLMIGLLEPDSGELQVLGTKPTRFSRRHRSSIGYMPQIAVLYPDLSLWENLAFCASLFGVPWRGRRKRMDQVLELVELGDAKHRKFRQASGGMQRRLSLAATLVHDPDLLFLDEPTAGVDPLLRKKFWDHLTALSRSGKTVCVTTQYVSEAAYFDLVGVMHSGRILVVEEPDALRRRALGGDVVVIRTTEPLGAGRLEDMAEAVGANRVDLRAANQGRLVVEDAGDAIPVITDWASRQGVNVESIEQEIPPFDDVFVELIHALAPEEADGRG